MIPAATASLPPASASRGRAGWSRWLALGAWLGVVVGLVTGCSTLGGRAGTRPPTPIRPAELPAQVVANFFLIEARQTDGRTYRFVVDTGSTATLVSPRLAEALRTRAKRQPARPVQVRGADGGETSLAPATLRELRLGAARFRRVPVLVHDLADLSAHLGLRVDGLLGFPLFARSALTLDYPHGRLALAPALAAPDQPPGPDALAFNREQGTPLVPVQLGNESFVVLLDTGSDAALTLNPAGLHPRFAVEPRPGKVVSSLVGDRPQLIGRLEQSLSLGRHRFDRPVVDLTDQLSSLGGDALRHFTITFDSGRNTVTFAREGAGPVLFAPRRDPGLSFARGDTYWRLLSVVPDTPAAGLGLQPGDLCVRINGEPVTRWDHARYAALVAGASQITFTFLSGTRETDHEVPVVALVP